MRRWAIAVVLVWVLATKGFAGVPYEERSAAGRVLLNVVAGVANVTPGISAVWANQCLPGYVFCKATFALVSVIAAGEQVLFSGAGDMKQAKALLHRGFGGDWFLTGRHVNGDIKPAVWPEAAPQPASLAP